MITLYFDAVAKAIIQISPSQAVIHKIACSTYDNVQNHMEFF